MRSPHPLFDVRYYFEQEPQLLVDQIEPLEHYETIGWKAGLNPHPSFDGAAHLAQCHATNVASPLLRFVFSDDYRTGSAIATTIKHHDTISMANVSPRHNSKHNEILAMNDTAINLFDRDYYLDNNQDVRDSKLDPFVHYSEHGWREGRKPSENFDPRWYLAKYDDVRAADIEPLRHYIEYGHKEGRIPVPIRNPILDRLPLSQTELDMQTRWLGSNHSIEIEPGYVVFGIVTYNNSDYELERCFASIESSVRYANTNLIKSSIYVIDNGDKSKIEPCMLKFKHFDSLGNVGFGAAHNVMLNEAFSGGADFYIAVNPDGALHAEALNSIIRMAQADKIPSIIEALQFPDEHPKLYDPVTFETNWASGALMTIPKQIYDSIGGFDETFFMYCEDVDLSWRAKLNGFKIKTCPTALFFHPTSNRDFDGIIHERFIRSSFYLGQKWGNTKFTDKLRLDATEMDIHLPYFGINEISSPPSFCDFSNGFSFSAVRW